MAILGIVAMFQVDAVLAALRQHNTPHGVRQKSRGEVKISRASDNPSSGITFSNLRTYYNPSPSNKPYNRGATMTTPVPNAPAAASNRLPLLVLIFGLATTALVLYGHYFAETHYQENVMGLYADYVIPVGALIAGLIAGSGYGLTSYFSGVKIRR